MTSAPSHNLHTVQAVSTYLKSNFGAIDFDGDGRIGRTDVLKMIKKSEQYDETVASAFLYHYRGHSGTSEMPIDCNHLERLSEPKFLDKAQRTLDQLARKEASGELFSKHRIDPTSIIMGAVADSKFTATLAALSATPHGDKRIRSMIERTEDGAYVVTFPGAPNQPIQIRDTTLQEKMVGSYCADGCRFVTLLERAYNLHCQVMRITKGRWGQEKDPFELLIGSEPTVIAPQQNNSLSTTASDMRNRQQILLSLKSYKAVTLTTSPDRCSETSGYSVRRRIAERQAKGFQLKGAHTYALIDFNEHTRMATICDASKAAIKDQHGYVQGEINIQLSELERCFAKIELEP